MDIEKIRELADWAEGKTKTKTGWFILYIILITLFFCVILWLVYGQLQTAKAEKQEAQRQVSASIEREARIKDDCAETMRRYFAIFKELGTQFSGNLNSLKAIEIQTGAAIQQQNTIIHKATHDEED